MFKCTFLIIASFLCGISAHVKVVNVTNCPKFSSEIEGVSLKTRFKNSKFDANLTVPFDLDDEVHVKAIIHTKDGKNWEDTGFELNGDFCYLMTGVFENAWKKAVKLMKLPKVCPVEKGTYKLKGLTASYKDLRLEFSHDGEYLLEILLSRNDKNMACRYVQVLISPDD